MIIVSWEFESPPLHILFDKNKLYENLPFIRYAAIAQLVERDLAKVEVAGPSPVCRSLFDEKQYLFMNLYIRFFDNEALVHNADEALDFLASIPEIPIDKKLEDEIRSYVDSDVMFPKRCKVRPHVYFIIIKTEAATMQDFKDKKALRSNTDANHREANEAIARLNEERDGWYEGSLDFKRVVLVPGTGKHEYRDTHFVADCKAVSGLDCYNRIVDYLQSRVDRRSQFPSSKGKNFKFKYLGMWK